MLQKCLNVALCVPLTCRMVEKVITDLDIIEVFSPDCISEVVL